MRITLPFVIAIHLVFFADSDRALESIHSSQLTGNEGILSETPDYILPIQAQDALTAKANRLDRLFVELLVARDGTVARDLESKIWNLWILTGDDESDQLMNQAIEDMNSGSFESSLGKLNTLVKRIPDHSEAWNKKATVLYLLHRYGESLADISKVLSLEPRHFGAISGIALISLARGDKKAALEAYRRAIKIYPLMPGAAAIIGVLEQEVEGIEL